MITLFKVIGLSETAINENSICYDIPDFRSGRKEGVVSLYILDTLQYKLRNYLQLGGEVSSVFIEIFKTSSNTKRNVCMWMCLQTSKYVFSQV